MLFLHFIYTPVLLIRLRHLEVHGVAAMKFGLAAAEDSVWEIYIKL